MNPAPTTLGESEQLLAEAYDCAMLDLDGVVYVGGDVTAAMSPTTAES